MNFLFNGSVLTLLVVLKWLFVVTLELPGSWSNMVFLRALSWVLSFTSYIQPTFQPYFLNTCQLVTSMLTMYRRLSILGVVLDSTLTFLEHIANLTRSSYFYLRRLRAIRRSVSSSVCTSIVHAFICSRIDYCNSLLVGLPKVRLSPLQSVLNAAARLIARLPRSSHISAFMFDHLHWLPLTARVQRKALSLNYRSYTGRAPKYYSAAGVTI